jgi:hypothetical protein
MTLLPNRTVLLEDSSHNAESWHVTFGDGTTHSGGFDTLYHTYAASGIYQICLEISNFAGTCTDKFCLLADFSSSKTSEADKDISLVIQPNPARDLTFVRLAGATPRRAVLFDVFGKIVLEKNVSTPEFELALDGLPAGVYFLNIETDKGRVVQKVVVSD